MSLDGVSHNSDFHRRARHTQIVSINYGTDLNQLS